MPPVQLSAQARHIHNRPIEVGGAAGLSGQLHFPSMDHVNQGVYYTDVTLDSDIRALR